MPLGRAHNLIYNKISYEIESTRDMIFNVVVCRKKNAFGPHNEIGRHRRRRRRSCNAYIIFIIILMKTSTQNIYYTRKGTHISRRLNEKYCAASKVKSRVCVYYMVYDGKTH